MRRSELQMQPEQEISTEVDLNRVKLHSKSKSISSIISPKRKLRRYVNDQNIRLALEYTGISEIEDKMDSNAKICRQMLGHAEGYLVGAYEHKERVIDAIKGKFDRDGIMRRNKLLLEHIMVSELHNSNYFIAGSVDSWKRDKRIL